MANKKKLTRGEAIEILSNMAKTSLVDILDSELNVDKKKLKRHKHALRELTIKPTKDGNQLQIKMYDKKAIIEQLANLQGWKESSVDGNIDTLKDFLGKIIDCGGDYQTNKEIFSDNDHGKFKIMGQSHEA